MGRKEKTGPDPIDVHVGKRLKTRRVGLGISQADLGKKLGITFQQIQKYENGSNRISASNLFKFAYELEINASYFFEGTPNKKEINNEGSKIDPTYKPEAVKLVHNYFHIQGAAVRQQIFNLMKAASNENSK